MAKFDISQFNLDTNPIYLIHRLDMIDIIPISFNTSVSLPCPLNTSISVKRTSPDL